MDFIHRPILLTNERFLKEGSLLIAMERELSQSTNHGYEVLAGPFLTTKTEGKTTCELNYEAAYDVYINSIIGAEGPQDIGDDFYEDLDRFVLGQSLVAMSTLKKLYASPQNLAINVSGHSLVSDVFYKDIIESLDDQSKIVRELTETAKIFDLEHITPVFSELTKRGIEFHLDDFGTGYYFFRPVSLAELITLINTQNDLQTDKSLESPALKSA